MTSKSKKDDPVTIDQPADQTDGQAADGNALPPAARSADAFIRMLEDGQLNADLTRALSDINAALNQHVLDHGGKPKASLRIDVGFQLDGGIFEIRSKFKITLPEGPRGKTIAWSTPDHDFTPNNPRQGKLFGVRDA